MKRNPERKPVRMRTKLFLSFLLASLLPLVIFLSLNLYRTVQEFNTKHNQLLNQINHQISNNVDSLLTTATSVATLNHLNRNVMKIMADHQRLSTSSPEYISNNNYMQELLVQLTSLDTNIENVVYITVPGGNVYARHDILDENAEEILSMASGIDWAGRQNYISDLNTGYTGIGREKIFFILTPVHDVSQKIIAYSCVMVRYSRFFNSLLGETQKEESSSSTVIFRGNQAFYPMAQDDAYDSKLLDALSQLESEDSLVVRGREYNVIQSVNESTGWKICQFVPREQLQNEMWGSLSATLMLLPFLLVFLLMLSYTLSQSITTPIRRLIGSLDKLSSSHLSKVEQIPRGTEEIQVLVGAYNNMIERLEDSIEREYRYEIKQRNLQLQMLQAQINPHFLYNTLSTLSSIGNLYGVNQVVEISNSLADIMRYSIKANAIVPIRDEIKRVKSFVTIQEYRFASLFETEYDVDVALLRYPMLKFLIQPIVENAIQHGLEPKGKDGRLKIRVAGREGDIVISVSDNGVGIPASRLAEIQSQLHGSMALGEMETTDHVGILNCHLRIKSYYGDPYGLFIASREGEGTTTELVLPKREE